MTDKEAVLNALSHLPETASLQEISDELRLMAAIRQSRADIAAGRSKPHSEVTQLLDSWAAAWTTR